MSSQAALRTLIPGRVVVVSNKVHRNALAIILQPHSLTKKSSLSTDPLDKVFTVLILTNKRGENMNAAQEMKMTAEDKETDPFITRKILTLDGVCAQLVEEIRASDIAFICNKHIKTEASKIIEDHKKRQLPRFRYVMIFICRLIF